MFGAMAAEHRRRSPDLACTMSQESQGNKPARYAYSPVPRMIECDWLLGSVGRNKLRSRLIVMITKW